MGRRIGVLAGALLLVILLAVPARADAVLVGSTPVDGSVLPASPSEVQLVFSEPVRAVPDGLAVIGPDGDRVDDGVVRSPRPSVLVLRLPGLKVRSLTGTYTVTWRVVADDAHPAGGRTTFSIGAPGRAAHVRAARASRALGIAFGVARFAAFAGFAVLVGTAVLCCVSGVATPAIRRLLLGGWSVSVLAAVAVLLLQGPYAAGRGLPQAVDLLGPTLHSPYGTRLAVRLLLLGLLPAVLTRAAGPLAARHRPVIAGGVAVAVGLAATWTTSVAGIAHLLAAAVWAGGLAALPFLPRAAASRFARVTLFCVGLLAVTGLIQAWPAVGTPPAVLTTTYGRLLGLKAGLLAAVVVAGYLLRGRRAGALADLGIAAVVLALTAVLVQSPPADQAYAARSATLSARFQNGRVSVRLPATTRGVSGGEVSLQTGRPPAGLTGSWTHPRLRVGPLPVQFTPAGPGRYRASWPPLPLAGTWRLTLTVRLSDGGSATVQIQRPIS